MFLTYRGSYFDLAVFCVFVKLNVSCVRSCVWLCVSCSCALAKYTPEISEITTTPRPRTCTYLLSTHPHQHTGTPTHASCWCLTTHTFFLCTLSPLVESNVRLLQMLHSYFTFLAGECCTSSDNWLNVTAVPSLQSFVVDQLSKKYIYFSRLGFTWK